MNKLQVEPQAQVPLWDTKADGPTYFTRDNQFKESNGETVFRWNEYAITQDIMQSIITDAVAFALRDLPEYCLRLILDNKSK